MGKAKKSNKRRKTKGKVQRPSTNNNVRNLIIATVCIIVIVIGVRLYKSEEVNSNIGLDPVKGPPDAKVTIIEYSDFQCPACGFMQPVVNEIAKKYPKDVKVIYKNFPLTRAHKWAYTAALAGECAFDQGKFWEFHDTIFEQQKSWSTSANARDDFLRHAKNIGMDENRLNECIDSGNAKKRVDLDMSEGNRLNINSTPTFFINGKRVVGAWRVGEFDKQIKKAIESL
jgi:protein-disulfide isomerase